MTDDFIIKINNGELDDEELFDLCSFAYANVNEKLYIIRTIIEEIHGMMEDGIVITPKKVLSRIHKEHIKPFPFGFLHVLIKGLLN